MCAFLLVLAPKYITDFMSTPKQSQQRIDSQKNKNIYRNPVAHQFMTKEATLCPVLLGRR